MILKKGALFSTLLALALPALAGYEGTDYNRVLKKTALTKCGYVPPNLIKQRQNGSVMTYQFTCGSIFKVVLVECTALNYKVRAQDRQESNVDYEAFQLSVKDQPTMYLCQ